jgi:hypothetical protein
MWVALCADRAGREHNPAGQNRDTLCFGSEGQRSSCPVEADRPAVSESKLLISCSVPSDDCVVMVW